MATILIVDDEKFMRTRLKEIITSYQLAENILDVPDGASAIDMYKKIKIDLVTMDISMPKMDGMACMRLIRQFDPLAKVLMISSVEDQDLIDDSTRSGAVGYITKPFDENNVVTTVKKLLN